MQLSYTTSDTSCVLMAPTQADIDAAFPLHQVLAIKERAFENGSTGDTPLFRVDSPLINVCSENHTDGSV